MALYVIKFYENAAQYLDSYMKMRRIAMIQWRPKALQDAISGAYRYKEVMDAAQVPLQCTV